MDLLTFPLSVAYQSITWRVRTILRDARLAFKRIYAISELVIHRHVARAHAAAYRGVGAISLTATAPRAALRQRGISGMTRKPLARPLVRNPSDPPATVRQACSLIARDETNGRMMDR